MKLDKKNTMFSQSHSTCCELLLFSLVFLYFHSLYFACASDLYGTFFFAVVVVVLVVFEPETLGHLFMCRQTHLIYVCVYGDVAFFLLFRPEIRCLFLGYLSASKYSNPLLAFCCNANRKEIDRHIQTHIKTMNQQPK